MKRLLKYIGIGIMGLAFIFGILSFGAQTHAAGGPTVTFTPSYSLYYGINGGSLTMSSGPYTQDFRVTMCLIPTLPGGQNGTPAPTSDPIPLGEPSNAQCATTPWASTLGTSEQYTGVGTQWVGQAQDDPYWCNNINCTPYITVETRPLPTGMALEDMQLGIEFADDNKQPPATSYYCNAWTPIFGGTSPIMYGYSFGDCGDGGELSQKPNYFRLFMKGYDLTFSATAASNNIPTTFNTLEKKTLGTDNNPLQISVTNTGSIAWGEDNHTTIAGSEVGTCDDVYPWYACPDISRPTGSSCTVGINNWSSDFDLKHVSGSFGVGTDPVQLSTPSSTATCTIGPIGCDNHGDDTYTGVSCNNDEATCENTNTYCLVYDQDDPNQCDQMSVACASVWEPQVNVTYGGAPVFNYIAPGQTATFPLGSLTAPSTPGTYTETWQMNSEGTSYLSGDDYPYKGTFGDLIPITITVGTSASTVSSVSVSCTPSTIDISQTSQCMATVNGTNSPSQSVTWGATNGTITSGGVFTPSGPGAAIITATSTQDSTQSGSTTVTVTAGGTSGPITVESENSVLPNIPVTASWQFSLFQSVDPCAATNLCGYLSNAIYNNMPYGPYIIDTNSFKTNESYYALDSQEEVPIAIQQKSLAEKLIAFGKDMLAPTVNADGRLDLSTPASQLLNTPQGIDYVIVWYPIADIGFNPDPVDISGTAGSTSPATTNVTLSNTGAPGSTVIWNATSNSSWLTVSPNADAMGLTNGDFGNASEDVTISASSTGLSASAVPYTGTITFNGTSTVDGSSITKTLTVNFTVTTSGGGIGAGYDCDSNNQCVKTLTNATYPDPGGLPSCMAACNPPPPPPPPVCTFSATPTTVVIPEQATLSYNCSNITSCSITGGNISSPIGIMPPGTSTGVSGTTSVTPTTSSIYTISCTGPGGTTSASAPVSVGNSTLCESNPGGVNCPKP